MTQSLQGAPVMPFTCWLKSIHLNVAQNMYLKICLAHFRTVNMFSVIYILYLIAHFNYL